MAGPLEAFAATTLPVSSRMTSTVTVPEVLIRFAASGYIGGGRKTAVPFRTPPETGLRIGFGPGLGGGSESRFTIGATWLGLYAGDFTSTGVEESLVAEAEADGNSGKAVLVF